MRRAAGSRRPTVWALGAVALLLTPACFAGTAELSESGKGLPEVTVEFPTATQPGSLHEAAVEVTNPGPGDISSVVVTFARVGAPAVEGIPNPIVDPGRGPESGSVVSVDPAPAASSKDVMYRFGPLSEGESTTITFGIEVPRRPGPAANSLSVYDAGDPGRTGGVRLETVVQR